LSIQSPANNLAVVLAEQGSLNIEDCDVCKIYAALGISDPSSLTPSSAEALLGGATAGISGNFGGTPLATLFTRTLFQTGLARAVVGGIAANCRKNGNLDLQNQAAEFRLVKVEAELQSLESLLSQIVRQVASASNKEELRFQLEAARKCSRSVFELLSALFVFLQQEASLPADSLGAWKELLALSQTAVVPTLPEANRDFAHYLGLLSS
jgi:hypothetical protein